jgi:hypothetical protein
MRSRDFFTPCVLAAIISVLSVANAKAIPITYTEVGTGSGALDGTSFTNQLVTIMMTADTSNITGGPTFFQNLVGTTTVSVSTVGTDTLKFAGAFANGQEAGFFVGVPIVIETSSSAFASYALGVIGPTSGPSVINPGINFQTGTGTFGLTSMGDTTFSATVPLPAALPLFATGLVGLGLLGWRRKKKAAA